MSPTERRNKAALYKDNAGKWRWWIKAPNGEIIAHSAMAYGRRKTALDRLRLATHAPYTLIEED